MNLELRFKVNMLIIAAKNNFDGNIGISRKGVIFFETFLGDYSIAFTTALCEG